MKNTKLIMVEGIMGSGKTSTASWMKEYLGQQHVKVSLFLEGDLNHPVDFESVACLNEQEYHSLLQQFAHHEDCIMQLVYSQGENHFFYYEKARQNLHNTFPDDLYTYITAYDIYKLPLDRYCELLLQSWRNFVEEVASKHEVVILECCFLQNPMCALLARSNVDEESIIPYILQLADIIAPLQPVLVYLQQVDTRKTLNRVIQERSQEWLDFVIWYYTEQDYGKAHGLSGFDGFIEVLEVRKRLELEIFDKLQIDKLLIDNSEGNWEHVYEEVMFYLNSK